MQWEYLYKLEINISNREWNILYFTSSGTLDDVFGRWFKCGWTVMLVFVGVIMNEIEKKSSGKCVIFKGQSNAIIA